MLLDELVQERNGSRVGVVVEITERGEHIVEWYTRTGALVRTSYRAEELQRPFALGPAQS